MRLTTKIIIGAIVSIFLISLTFIVCLPLFVDKKAYQRLDVYSVDLPQDNINGVELGSFNTIVIDEIPHKSRDWNYFLNKDNYVSFDANTESDKPDMMFIPEFLKDFVSTETFGDTLKIKIDIYEIGNKYKSEEYKNYSIMGLYMHFKITETDIISNLHNLSINVSNFETDSIKIKSYGSIFIDSCKAQLIDPCLKIHYDGRLIITNSETKRVNLDLDNISDWNIEKCKIEEQYITGSNNHYITHRKEAGIINWIPKNNDARLIIQVEGDTTRIVFQ